MHLLFVDPSGTPGTDSPALALARSAGTRVTVCSRRPAGLVGTLTDEVVVDPAHLPEIGLGWTLGDFVTVTATPAEFLARARRLGELRSRRTSRHVSSGDLSLDLHRQTLHAGSTSISLTARESGALTAFLTSNGAVLTREELSTHCSDGRADHVRHVDVFICRLRRKLGPHGARIETVRRVGYRLAAGAGTRSLTAA